MKQSLEKIIGLLIAIILSVLVFIIPVYFSLFFITNDVFELNKSVIFNILVLILAWLTFLKFLVSPERARFARLFGRPETIKTLVILAGFLIAFGLSTWLSIDQGISFYGAYDRSQGMATYFYVFAFFLILIFNLSFPKAEGLSGIQSKSGLNSGFAMTVRHPSTSRLTLFPPDSNRDGNDKERGGNDNKEAGEGREEDGNGKGETGSLFWVLIAIAAAGLVAAGYGLLQAGGYDFLPWTESTRIRATSTFGQPNSLGSFLLFSIPVTFYLLITAKWLWLRIVLGIPLIVQLLTLVFTYSMSSWLGLIGGTGVVGLAWLYFVHKTHPWYIRAVKTVLPSAAHSQYSRATPLSRGDFSKSPFGGGEGEGGLDNQAHGKNESIARTSQGDVSHPTHPWYVRAVKTARTLAGYLPVRRATPLSRGDFSKSPLACPPELQRRPGGGEGGVVFDDSASGKNAFTASTCQGDVTVGADKKYRKFLKYGVLAGAAILLIVFAGNHFFNPGVLKLKISNLFDFQAGSTAARTQFWSASWAGVKERPIFGHGPETQADVIVKYYEPDWAVYSNANVMPNRAHNLILDLLLTQGIIGLAAFLALYAWVIKLVTGNIRARREPGLNYALLFALIGYFVYLQFNFHHLTTLVYFFLFAALAVVIRGGQISGKFSFIVPAESPAGDSAAVLKHGRVLLGKLGETLPEPKNVLTAGTNRAGAVPSLASLMNFSLFAKLFAAVVLSVIVFLGAGREFNRLVSDHYFFRLREAHAAQELFTTFMLYDYLKEKSPRYSYYDIQYAYMLADWTSFLGDHAFTRIVKERLAPLYALMPENNYTQIYLKGVAAAALADDADGHYFRESEQYLGQAIALSPDIPKNYRELGMVLNKKGEYGRAIEALNTAFTKLPDLDNPYMNALHRSKVEREMYLNYLRLGEAHEGLGELEPARNYYELALEKNPHDESLKEKLAEIMETAGM